MLQKGLILHSSLNDSGKGRIIRIQFFRFNDTKCFRVYPDTRCNVLFIGIINNLIDFVLVINNLIDLIVIGLVINDLIVIEFFSFLFVFFSFFFFISLFDNIRSQFTDFLYFHPLVKSRFDIRKIGFVHRLTFQIIYKYLICIYTVWYFVINIRRISFHHRFGNIDGSIQIILYNSIFNLSVFTATFVFLVNFLV